MDARQQFVQADAASHRGLTEALGLTSNAPTSKVLFRVPEDEGGSTVDTLWSVPLSDDRYTLDDSLFYADGVSLQGTIFPPSTCKRPAHAAKAE